MTESQPYRLLVADLDGTLLHDGETFEDRFLTQGRMMPACGSRSPPHVP